MLIAQHVNVISDQISPSKQGWTREVTARWAPHGAPQGTRFKLRATVYRDSYDFQSRIKVEVWDPASLSWNTVRTLAGEDHKDLPRAYTLAHGKDQAEGRRVIFDGTAELVDELFAYAQEILA